MMLVGVVATLMASPAALANLWAVQLPAPAEGDAELEPDPLEPWPADRPERWLPSAYKDVRWRQSDSAQCYMARNKLRLYWERTREIPDKIQGGIEAIKIDDRCPIGIRKRVLAAIQKHRRVFEEGIGKMPLAVAGGLVHLGLKSDAKARRCPEPEWGQGAKRRIMEKWADDKLATGEFEHAPQLRWASRPHIAMKRKRGAAQDDDDFGIRVCGDSVYVNSQCVRLQPNAPSARAALDRAKGKHAYWYTDGDRQYNGWQLDEESRDIAAIWTPRGLLRPTRLQFGLMNAGIVTQGDLRVMRQHKLSKYAKDHSVNIADDFRSRSSHPYYRSSTFVLPGLHGQPAGPPFSLLKTIASNPTQATQQPKTHMQRARHPFMKK